jgi:serine/threonine protein kinase/class 3 adenylate cyclase
MSLDDYRLLKQLSVGADGAAFRALADDGRTVEVRTLAAAKADAARWAAVGRRLRWLQMLDARAALALHEANLEHDPPYVVVEAVEKSIAEDLGGVVPMKPDEVMTLAQTLTQTVAGAHRLGIVHGRISPRHVFRASDGQIRLDFSGLDIDGKTAELDYQAPEITEGTAPTQAADLFSVGAVLHWLLKGQPPSASRPSSPSTSILDRLVSALLARDPADRPLTGEVLEQLGVGQSAATINDPAGSALLPVTLVAIDQRSTATIVQEAPPRERLGRYRLVQKLGEGGMGVVYRAEDPVDSRSVAIKVLRPDWSKKPEALRRFHKEARLLAEVNNPYVANLLEVNEDKGTHYLVLEFIEGTSLDQHLAKEGRLSERQALDVTADVARALAEAHERGIVHRDIKPQNILLQTSSSHPSFATKLTDFGLARHVVESESLNLTKTGALLGTPYYMSPEQCRGETTIDPRTDVYALGATLFHLLAGRPPFVGLSQMAVIAMHCNEPPPKLQDFNSAVSEATGQVIAKCLAKAPEDRYPGAGPLLQDLERLLRGEPTNLAVHPRLPPCDPEKVLRYDWAWQLDATPQRLWPHVSNTERLNRAAGLTPVQFTSEVEPDQGVRRYGQFRKAGVLAAWEEHPFEWIEARRMGVLREYRSGPFKWMVSIVELTPRPGGGTILTHRVRIEPHGMIGRTLAAVEVGIRGFRAVDKIYRRIDALLAGKLGAEGLADPFEEPPPLSPVRRRRLDELLDRLGQRGIEPAVLERFGEFLALAPPQEAARIRPLALARRLGLDPEQTASACLHGAREGLLLLLWDILCPVCRIPSDVKETLKALQDHGRCEACNLDFELDFANSVEMIFRAHPEVRETELGVYCIGGPAHSPHVAAQVRVGAGERIELDLALTEGSYRLRGPQLPFTLDFHVQPSSPTSRWEIDLGFGPDAAWPPLLKAGRQTILLRNSWSHELVARIERTAPRENALTAARASTMALFRELFPGETLSSGQLVSVANVTLLCTKLDHAEDLYHQLGDAKAFAIVHEHFRLLNDCIRREGGALVKTVGEGLFAAFTEPTAALRAGLAFQPILTANEQTRDLHIRVAVHRGPAMTATLNDHLDYFGSTVNFASRLLDHARGGELVLSQATAEDSQVSALLQLRGIEAEMLTVKEAGREHALLQRLRPADEPHPRN